MTGKEVIRAALAKTGISQMELSEMLGYKNKTSVGAILNKNSNLRTDVFVKWLDMLGFEVIIRDKNDKTTEFVLTIEEDKQSAMSEAVSDRIAKNAAEMKSELTGKPERELPYPKPEK